jgi:hypothetical protein
MTPATQFEGDDLRKVDPKFQQPRFGQYLDAVGRLDRLARERHGKGVMQLAVRLILDQGADIALWGARHPQQVAGVGEVMGGGSRLTTRRRSTASCAKLSPNPSAPSSWRQ